ncbi:monomethylamine transporter [Methanohalophilus halophilus]|uniref:Monomethylamine transporter n=1 Tax=Methanohalophilus halophilus TaxID=2177 RepID=A0A1L3Q3E6_9EURY|nr:monomethylamine transporter [Methanohalophilus halophilus]APH39404.1 monomethylamine transporter [Methanohalophilus halophilus]
MILENKQTEANVDTVRYMSKLRQDALVVVALMGVLFFSESFIFYTIITTVWDSTPELSSIFPVYVLFLLLVLGIGTAACLRVYSSIKEHMYTFRYYD